METIPEEAVSERKLLYAKIDDKAAEKYNLLLKKKHSVTQKADSRIMNFQDKLQD